MDDICERAGSEARATANCIKRTTGYVLACMDSSKTALSLSNMNVKINPWEVRLTFGTRIQPHSANVHDAHRQKTSSQQGRVLMHIRACC